MADKEYVVSSTVSPLRGKHKVRLSYGECQAIEVRWEPVGGSGGFPTHTERCSCTLDLDQRWLVEAAPSPNLPCAEQQYRLLSGR